MLALLEVLCTTRLQFYECVMIVRPDLKMDVRVSGLQEDDQRVQCQENMKRAYFDDLF